MQGLQCEEFRRQRDSNGLKWRRINVGDVMASYLRQYAVILAPYAHWDMY